MRRALMANGRTDLDNGWTDLDNGWTDLDFGATSNAIRWTFVAFGGCASGIRRVANGSGSISMELHRKVA
jgi:hypothetical protein